MADVTGPLKAAPGGAPSGSRRSSPERERAELHEFAELLFFAYRDFISDPDAILTQYGFGRAHHRVLHFVHRYPGLRVADLLGILKITKQSLGRVLRALIEQGFVDQRAGHADRRERLLHLTDDGRALAERLAAPQRERLAQALAAAAGALPEGESDAREVVRRFLYCMITEPERDQVAKLLSSRSQRLGDGEGR